MIHLIETVYRFLWGDLFVLPIAGGVGISLMVVLLLTAGVFFTLRTRLLPMRLFRDMSGFSRRRPRSYPGTAAPAAAASAG